MNRIKKIVITIALLATISCATTGCIKPYDKPELVTIEPSQTAFLIPLIGDAENQSSFDSEEFLNTAKVPTKEVQIPHRWVKTGRMESTGEWRQSARLIVVERKPETREWTESTSDGTSSANQGITAESMESTAFMARMNISAQIEESSATRFLYRYNNKPLAEILDTEIRAKVEEKFVEECAERTMEEILVSKANIMTAVKEYVIPYFSENGITVTTLGLKGEFTYLNQEIQKSIDRKFQSAQDLVTQQNENERVLSKAKADAEAVKIQSETYDQTIKMKELENQAKAIEKWNGQLPQVQGETTSIIDLK